MDKRGRKKEEWMKRLQRYITVEGECWRWTGPVSVTGMPVHYVGTSFGSKLWQTRKLLYSLFIDRIQTAVTIVPVCEQHDCVNPWHVKVSSRYELDSDRRAKLQPHHVVEIRNRWVNRRNVRVTLVSLAQEYGVSKQAIDFTVRGAMHKKCGGPISGKARASLYGAEAV